MKLLTLLGIALTAHEGWMGATTPGLILSSGFWLCLGLLGGLHLARRDRHNPGPCGRQTPGGQRSQP